MKPGRGRAVYAGLAVASAIVAVGAPGVEAADVMSAVTAGQNAASAFEDRDGPGITGGKTGPSRRVRSGNGAIGSWVVNLHSLQNRAAAEDFAALARAQGIEVELSNVKVRGKQFWRIQVTGFPTADEARSYAGASRNRLRLKEVWVMKR